MKFKSEILTLIVIVILIAVVINILIRESSEEIKLDGDLIIEDVSDIIKNESDEIYQPLVKDEEIPNSIVIEIHKSSFLPENVTIKKGTTVMFVNKDFKNHKIAARTILINGSTYQEFYGVRISTNETYNYTFNRIGVYPYFDVVFLKYMSGTITVIE